MAGFGQRLIERLLLVEDSYDQLLETENKAEVEEMRLRVFDADDGAGRSRRARSRSNRRRATGYYERARAS